MAREAKANSEFAWDRFDPEAYVAHYYGEPHPDDDEVVRLTCAALAQAGRDIETIDVGTGPNLFPLFAALPVARRLTVWEYAETNITWMRNELARRAVREPWTHFWNVVRESTLANVAGDPVAALEAKTDIVQGSIFDLPERRWDAATMFFCAESITADQAEFERACAAFARAVRPRGVLAAAFLAGSRGYRVGEEDYPAVAVSIETIERAFAPHANAIAVTPIGAMGEEIRSGYTGMLFLTARAV